MIKIYHLSTCSTCKRIISELGLPNNTIFQDIKFESITEIQLLEMHNLAGSYESLFSRKARKFRLDGWHEKDLNETDFKGLILIEYTFLKRPVLIIDKHIYIGNTSKVVEAARSHISNL